MKRTRFSLKAAALGFTYMLLGLSPAYGDDIDMFTGKSLAGAKNPNILLIIDTSGSMDEKVNGKERLQHVKDAAKSWLSTVENVNVGLMRFSVPGGPVLYPITDVNAPLNSVGEYTQATRRVGYGVDDGFEFTSGTVSSQVKLTNDGLQIASGVPVTSAGTVTASISASNNDAEQAVGNNSPLVNGVTLDVPYEGSTLQVVGLRFPGLAIPKNASIESATIEFVVKDNPVNSETMDTIIEASTDTNAFTTASNNIDGRTRFSEKAYWSETEAATIGSKVTTSNFANVVEEVVRDGSWNSGQAMTFIIRRNEAADLEPSGLQRKGNRRFYTFDSGDSTKVAKLTIKYTAGSTENSMVGLRFRDVSIPRGVEITSAKLRFTTNNANLSNAASFTISGENTDNSAEFSATNGNLTSRPKTSSISWTPDNWTTAEGQEEVDITSIIEEITSSSTSWCGGNALSLFIEGSGERFAQSFETNTVGAPVLDVTYKTSSVPSSTCQKQTFVRQVSASQDDAEEKRSDTSAATLTSSDLDLMKDGSTSYDIGIRFNNIKIPKDSTIISAYLDVVANATGSGTSSITIYGNKVASASPFTASNNSVSLRATTSESEPWTISGTWTKDTTYRSTDIKDIIAELVNQSDWASGNSIALILKGNTGANPAYSWDGSKGYAPKLVINFINTTSSSAEPTAREALIDTIDGLSHDGATPLQDILYEAALYYRGNNVDYGKKRGSGPYSYTRVSHEKSIEPSTYNVYRPAGCTEDNLSASACKDEVLLGTPKYKMPITDECSANYIVLLTDGEANSPNSETKIKKMIQTGTATPTCADTGGNACGPELTKYLYENDQVDDAIMDGDQKIITHVIGFNIVNDWLRRLPTSTIVGNSRVGQFFSVEDGDSLEDAFETITVQALDDESTLVAPVAAVNAFNRVFTRNEIYYSVFKPSDKGHWAGNLKRYELGPDLTILDSNQQNAIGEDGRFTDTSKSFWSDIVDGAEVSKGGAEGEITNHATRTIYTQATSALTLSDFKTTNTTLTASSYFNPISSSGMTTSKLIDWARGADIGDVDADGNTTETRSFQLDSNGKRIAGSFIIGDPLHSRPMAITYGGTETDPDITMYMTTNAGFIHAFNVSNNSKNGVAPGGEIFSFIPQELLKNLDKLYANTNSDHIYGLDSPITNWIIDKDIDGQIETSDGDKVYLYFGMRRGGNNYYAMDVSNRSNPKLMWKILGGTTGNFAELGQSWAQPLRVKINVNTGTSVETRTVLILGGGYDVAQDDRVTTGTTGTDTVGNAIFIVDALTGELIWKGTKNASAAIGSAYNKQFTELKYSIPAMPAALDINSDGLIDQLYVGDMGGQLWRFDIINGSTPANLVKGGVIATLGDADDSSPEAIESRRFYHTPDIGLSKNNNGTPFIAIYIGSGWRESPLNTQIKDRFYMVKQYSVFNAPSSYTKLTESSLYDATENLADSDTESTKQAALNSLNSSQGWYFDLNGPGEKVLSSPLVFFGTVYFNTFEPTNTIVGCSVTQGTNRAYAVNALTATDAVNWGTATAPGTEGRATTVNSMGPGGDPSINFRMNDGELEAVMPLSPTKFTNPDFDPDQLGQSTYWNEQ